MSKAVKASLSQASEKKKKERSEVPDERKASWRCVAASFAPSSCGALARRCNAKCVRCMCGTLETQKDEVVPQQHSGTPWTSSRSRRVHTAPSRE